MSKILRTLSILSRPSIGFSPLTRYRSPIFQHRGYTNVQLVQFRHPGIRTRRMTRLALKSTLVLLLTYYLIEHVLEDDEEEAKGKVAVAPGRNLGDSDAAQAVSQPQEAELEVQLPDTTPENAIFIPLWWAKERRRIFYKGSDPEWQGFVKFAKDEKRKDLIRREIAGTVRDAVDRHPQFRRSLDSPIRIKRTWLDFDFPSGPPKEYDRPGIEIADDYIALTTRPQSEAHYQSIKSALWPDSIAKSFWASYSTYVSLQYHKIREFLNIKTEDENMGRRLPPGTLNLHQLSKARNKEDPQIKAGLDKMSDPKPIDVTTPKSTNSPSVSEGSRILNSLPAIFPQADGDLGTSVATFKQTLAKTWRPPTVIERGAFFVSGLVEVEGPKGRYVLDVLATYHPQKNQINIFGLGVRRGSQKRIAPRGL